jgi:hypothetical protein
MSGFANHSYDITCTLKVVRYLRKVLNLHGIDEINTTFSALVASAASEISGRATKTESGDVDTCGYFFDFDYISEKRYT